MVHQFSVRLTTSKRHHQRVDNKISGLAFAHRPADHRPVMKIDDPSKEQFPGQTFELTDISHPTLIRTLRCEVAFQQIRSVCGVRPATPPTFAAVRPDKSRVGHQAGDAVLTDPPAVTSELSEQAR
jgi:hypothetical protein